MPCPALNIALVSLRGRTQCSMRRGVAVHSASPPAAERFQWLYLGSWAVEKSIKARVEAERRRQIILCADQFFEKTRFKVERQRVVKLSVNEQKYKKARAEAERRSVVKLTVEHKFEKARDDTERRIGESSQATSIRFIDKRHSYATRSMTAANRDISNV